MIRFTSSQYKYYLNLDFRQGGITEIFCRETSQPLTYGMNREPGVEGDSKFPFLKFSNFLR
ncbi:hypothetical protein [Lyngbya sp. PCC 8106]|uniref:hypothetical protein n=1 Tax=Lyngbya sp. (strain PCC 8106) TaxID=313612 RepID=UPI000306736C|nr:hypothetical protein [Lyngbya sp. PCC 8106]